eukprot:979525-Prymnesium_polylepis.2
MALSGPRSESELPKARPREPPSTKARTVPVPPLSTADTAIKWLGDARSCSGGVAPAHPGGSAKLNEPSSATKRE